MKLSEDGLFSQDWRNHIVFSLHLVFTTDCSASVKLTLGWNCWTRECLAWSKGALIWRHPKTERLIQRSFQCRSGTEGWVCLNRQELRNFTSSFHSGLGIHMLVWCYSGPRNKAKFWLQQNTSIISVNKHILKNCSVTTAEPSRRATEMWKIWHLPWKSLLHWRWRKIWFSIFMFPVSIGRQYPVHLAKDQSLAGCFLYPGGTGAKYWISVNQSFKLVNHSMLVLLLWVSLKGLLELGQMAFRLLFCWL